jgi:hypothetical protein
MSRNQRGGERMSSSVKWLSNETYELFEQYSEGNFDRITLNRLVLEATEKAKEMEKEKTIEFCIDWYFNGTVMMKKIDVKSTIDQHFNNTYGGGEQ